jgi:N-acetylglucosamine kinase-like BadF-type ATPase
MDKLVIGTDYGYIIGDGGSAVYLGNSIFQITKSNGISYRHSSYFFTKAIAAKL